MCIKKRLGKYRNSEQQFNTCSAVSCIYWTFDVIISSAVFFHNACERTCPHSTLEYGKNVRAALLTLSFMKRRKKMPLAWFMVGKGSWKPESGLKSLYPPFTNTIYTALTQPCKVRPKNLNQLLTSHWWDLWSLGPQHTRTHTQTHTHAHTRVSRTPDHPGRRDGKAGPSCRHAGKTKRDCVKLAAGQEIWND